MSLVNLMRSGHGFYLDGVNRGEKTHPQWAYHFLLGVLDGKKKKVCGVQTHMCTQEQVHTCVYLCRGQGRTLNVLLYRSLCSLLRRESPNRKLCFSNEVGGRQPHDPPVCSFHTQPWVTGMHNHTHHFMQVLGFLVPIQQVL